MRIHRRERLLCHSNRGISGNCGQSHGNVTRTSHSICKVRASSLFPSIVPVYSQSPWRPIMKKIILLTISIAISLSSSIHGQDTAESANRRGLDELNKQDYQTAAGLFEQAIALKPDYASAHFNLGTAYFYLRRTQPAIDALQRATKLDPSSASSHNQLGAVYLESGDNARAIGAFKEAAWLSPGYASALYNLGCAYIRVGDFKSAVGSLELAGKADPRNAEIRLNLAYALSREKRVPEAIAEMEAAVNLSPADADLRLGLGNLFVLANDRTRAAEQYKRLREMDPIAAQKLYDAIHGGRIVTVAALRRSRN